MTCGKGERPTKFVDRLVFRENYLGSALSKLMFGGRALKGLGKRNLTNPHKTPNAKHFTSDRLWVLRSMVERKKPRSPDKVPKS